MFSDKIIRAQLCIELANLGFLLCLLVQLLIENFYVDDSLCPESHDKGRPSNFKSKSWQLQLHGSLARNVVPNPLYYSIESFNSTYIHISKH